MTTKKTFTNIDLDKLSTVTGGSDIGNACRDGYGVASAVLGGALTSESGGWGAIPGAIAGGWLGRKLCPK
jgi:hypothetical protein